MKQTKQNGLGKYLYMEWLFPIRDYYHSMKINEILFEIIIPFIVAILCSVAYCLIGKLFHALNGLSELLPTIISILIGFTIMLITLLLTSSGDGINKLKTTVTDKYLYNKPITLYQRLHIQFSHSLFSEIILLLVIFLYLFLRELNIQPLLGTVVLVIEIYLTLNILFSILRGIANLYFSFYNDKN